MSGWGCVDGKTPVRIVPFTRWTPPAGHDGFDLREFGADVPVLFTILYGMPVLGDSGMYVQARMTGCRN